MTVVAFNEDTLAQMQKQAGPTQEPGTAPPTGEVPPVVPPADTPPADTVPPKVPEGTPDIDLVDPKVLADAAAAEAKIKADADKVATDAAAKEAQDKVDAEAKAKADAETVRVNETLKTAGIDPVDAEARILKDGGLTPEYIAELKTKVDPRLVDAYAERFETALTKAKTAEPAKAAPVDDTAVKKMNKFIFDSVGGKDKFTAMAGIIKSNADAATVDTINAKLRSDNQAVVQEGLSEAVAQYKKLTGRSTTSMSGEPAGNQNEAFVFVTKADYHAAIGTEKYKTDPVYAASMDEARLKSRKMDNAAILPGQYRNIRNGKMYAV